MTYFRTSSTHTHTHTHTETLTSTGRHATVWPYPPPITFKMANSMVHHEASSKIDLLAFCSFPLMMNEIFLVRTITRTLRTDCQRMRLLRRVINRHVSTVSGQVRRGTHQTISVSIRPGRQLLLDVLPPRCFMLTSTWSLVLL